MILIRMTTRSLPTPLRNKISGRTIKAGRLMDVEISPEIKEEEEGETPTTRNSVPTVIK